MELISYAQNYEDLRLWRAFRDVERGRYLDVGTQDPNQDSVSRLFYDRGWRGVHVEPTPAYASAMRFARPDETVIEAAVSNSPAPLVFFEIPNTGLSTGVPEIASLHKEAGWDFHQIVVPTTTLASLFDFMGPDLIHWLKIDVEGMEADVIASWGEHPARPAALVIEATKPCTQVPSHQSWHGMVVDRGYREVLFDGLSRYFIHESHAHRGDDLALSPNVFDGFQVLPTHFSAGKVAAQAEQAVEVARQEAEAGRNAELAALTARLQQMESEFGESIAAVRADLTAENAVLDQARIQAEAEVQARSGQLDEARAMLAQVSAELAVTAQRVGELESRVATEADAHAAALANAYATAADASSQLQAALQREVKLEQKLASENDAYVKAIGRAETAANQALAKLDAELHRSMQLQLQLKEQAQLQAAAIAASEERFLGAQRALSEANEYLGVLQKEYSVLSRVAGRIEGELSTQKKWFAAQLSDASALRDDLLERLERAEQQVDDSRNLTEQLRTDLASQILAADAASAAAASEKLAMSEMIASATDQMHHAVARAEELAANFSIVSGERDALLAQLQRLSSEHDDLKAAAAETELKLRSEAERLWAELADRQRRIEKVSQILVELPDPLRGLSKTRAAILLKVIGRKWVSSKEASRAAIGEWLSMATPVAIEGIASPTDGPLDSEAQRPHEPRVDEGAVSLVANEAPSQSLAHLLAQNDRFFIHAAYWALLGRAPEPEGEAYYLDRLRTGAHKLGILRQLRYSPEGQSFAPDVSGLDRALKRHRLATRPLIGPIVRYFTGIQGDSATHRQLRIIDNQLSSLHAELVASVFSLREELAAELTLVRSDMASLGNLVRTLPSGPTLAADDQNDISSEPLHEPIVENAHQPPPQIVAVAPPAFDAGVMPQAFDSQGRELLRSLRLLALISGGGA